jgi:hypothetical protein
MKGRRAAVQEGREGQSSQREKVDVTSAPVREWQNEVVYVYDSTGR